jgi:hypothetical protein
MITGIQYDRGWGREALFWVIEVNVKGGAGFNLNIIGPTVFNFLLLLIFCSFIEGAIEQSEIEENWIWHFV